MQFPGVILFFSSALIPCLWAALALGQVGLGTSPETGSVSQLVAEVRIDRELSDEMVQFIATQSVQVAMPRTRGRIEDLVREACGYTSPYNERVFTVALSNQGAKFDGDSFELAAAATQVPSCLPDEQQTRLVGRLPLEGDDFSGYFRRDLGVILSDSDNARQRVPINPGVELDIAGLVASYDHQGNDGYTSGSLTISGSFDATSVIAQAEDYLADSGVDPQDSSRLAYESWVTTDALVAAGIEPQTSRVIVDRSLKRLGVPDTKEILDTVDAARAAKQSEPRIRDLPFMVERCRAISGLEATYCDAPASKTPVTLPSRTSDVITTLNTRDRAPNADTIYANVPIISVEQEQKSALIPLASSDGAPPEQQIRQATDAEFESFHTETKLVLFDHVANDASETSRQCQGNTTPNWGNEEFNAAFRLALSTAVAHKRQAENKLNFTKLLVLDGGFVRIGVGSPGNAAWDAVETGSSAATLESPNYIAESVWKKLVHGSIVTGLAMGGPGLMDVFSQNNMEVNIASNPAYRIEIRSGATYYAAFDNIPSKMTNSQESIVNLSLGVTDEVQSSFYKLKTRNLNANAPLFIVAAGNLGNNNSPIGKLVSDTNLVPQIWGNAASDTAGTGAYNVLVVASLDWNGESENLAWFSNYEETYVYLAAPGCNVMAFSPTLNGKYELVAVSGTSFSTPIVSFVAAAVHSVLPEGRINAPWVRARLLATADIDRALDEGQKVKDGRILNAVAAVQVQQDLLTLKSVPERVGQLQLAPGRTYFKKDDFCDANANMPHQLLRFFRKPAGSSGNSSRFYVDLMTEDNFMTTTPCVPKTNTTITFRVNGEDEVVSITDIADLKFAIH